MRSTHILPLAFAAALASTGAQAAEWDQSFRPPNVTNTADFFAPGPGVSAFVFERVADGNDDPVDDNAILRRVDRATTEVFAVPLGFGLFPRPMVADATRV